MARKGSLRLGSVVVLAAASVSGLVVSWSELVSLSMRLKYLGMQAFAASSRNSGEAP